MNPIHSGVLIPEALMHTSWFGILATFVAINSLLYVTLAVTKILPRVYLSDWYSRRNRRTETRSIDPDAEI